MARKFNGTSDKIIGPGRMAFYDYGQRSISYWFNASATPSNFSVAFALTDVSTNAYLLPYFASAGTQMTVYSNGLSGSFASGRTFNLTTTTNVWHHHCLTFLGPSLAYTFYADAVAVDTTAVGVVGATDTVNYGIGFDPRGPVFFNGTVADCAMWGAALTQSEVTALFMGQRPGFIRPQSLRLWIDLAGYGALLQDRSIYKNNAVITGGAPVFAPGPPRIQGDAPIIFPLPDPSFVMTPAPTPPPPPFILMPQIVM
jgi:hypothetical protein